MCELSCRHPSGRRPSPRRRSSTRMPDRGVQTWAERACLRISGRGVPGRSGCVGAPGTMIGMTAVEGERAAGPRIDDEAPAPPPEQVNPLPPEPATNRRSTTRCRRPGAPLSPSRGSRPRCGRRGRTGSPTRRADPAAAPRRTARTRPAATPRPTPAAQGERCPRSTVPRRAAPTRRLPTRVQPGPVPVSPTRVGARSPAQVGAQAPRRLSLIHI